MLACGVEKLATSKVAVTAMAEKAALMRAVKLSVLVIFNLLKTGASHFALTPTVKQEACQFSGLAEFRHSWAISDKVADVT